MFHFYTVKMEINLIHVFIVVLTFCLFVCIYLGGKRIPKLFGGVNLKQLVEQAKIKISSIQEAAEQVSQLQMAYVNLIHKYQVH